MTDYITADSSIESTTADYIPAPQLVAASSLTESQLKECYQDFAHIYKYGTTSPALVFERVVANILNLLNINISAASNPSIAGSLPSPPLPAFQSAPSRSVSPAAPGYFSPYGGSQNNQSNISRRPTTGTFHTAEVLPAGICQGAYAPIVFSPPYNSPPRIATGLRWLSIGTEGTLRATTYAEEITRNSFNIRADNNDSQTRFGACASWVEIPSENYDFQTGTFNTTSDHPANEKKRDTFRRIVFEREYSEPPQVVAWFSSFEFERSGNPRAQTWCADVTTTGFLLYVSSREEPTLFSAEVSWAACSRGRSNTWMGTFKTSQPFPKRESGFEGLVSSSSIQEESAKVFVAINSIAVTMGYDLNVRVSCPKVNREGLSWYICTWDNSPVTEVGASFIVLG